MAAVVSPQDNWLHFRKLIRETTETFVPYIGLYLSDLTFIKDGGGDKLDNGHIGWQKNQKIASLIHRLQIMQIREMKGLGLPDEELQLFFATSLHTLPEKELFRLSREIEPPKKKKIIERQTTEN
eukprot:TRINITY_DN399_c0_g5_i1.p1 TRINITY_DN399_c0_g5~~TRINITY_DN399_c0_g5_i1.p1  ORF type:complete len:125 (-),score=39.09 TRINITY_DN399_c0_g5_i1:157-531(-)